MRKIIASAAVGGVLFVGALTGCKAADTPTHAPRNPDTTSSTSAAPAPARTPVTLTGTGESVKTVELSKGGYTVKYHADDMSFIAQPVNADGSDSFAWTINALAPNLSGPVDGTTTINAAGPVTIHVSNVNGDWSLAFTPLG